MWLPGATSKPTILQFAKLNNRQLMNLFFGHSICPETAVQVIDVCRPRLGIEASHELSHTGLPHLLFTPVGD